MKTLKRLLKEAASMRDVLTSRVRQLSVGWLWLAALIALPDCTFTGREPPTYTAVFCDFQKPLVGRHCATEADKSRGIRLAEAALALNKGDTIDVALDDSPEALDRCGGEPEANNFLGAFPQGQPVCVDDTDDALTACAVPCQQYYGDVQADGSIVPYDPPNSAVVWYCSQQAFARLSANLPQNPLGFTDGCTKGGKLIDGFVDPRRKSEMVDWDLASQIGVGSYENYDADHVKRRGLFRLAVTSSPPTFDAGAASNQWITHGDGHVEFSAMEKNLSHVIGLSEVPAGCVPPSCPDTDPTIDDMGFAISLNKDGHFYNVEHGQLLTGKTGQVLDPTSPQYGAWGTYNPGDRFRVKVKDNLDAGHTATISYSRIIGSCPTGNWCPETVFYESEIGPAHYPLRVDASFREYGARLGDVRIVYIH